MTSFIHKLFSNYWWDIWPFGKLKRPRSGLEEPESDFHASVSPPKRLKLNSAPFASKTFRDLNQTTVTSVRERPVLLEKSQSPREFSFQRPVKTTQPPTFKWTETFFLDDEDENTMPNRNSDRRARRSVNVIESIDLTEDKPRVKNVTYIDITRDEDPPKLEKTSNLVRKNSLPTSFLRNRHSVNRDMRAQRHKSTRGRLREDSKSTSLSSLQSYDLVERINFGKLLGSFVANQNSPGSLNRTTQEVHSPPEVIDLTFDERDDSSDHVLGAASPLNSFDKMTSLISPKIEVAPTSSAVSSSTKRGVNKELLRVNSFEKKVKDKKCADEVWLDDFLKDYQAQCVEFTATKLKLEQEVRLWNEKNKRQVEALLEEKLNHYLRITEAVIPDVPKDPYPPIIRPLPEVTSEMLGLISSTHPKRSTDVIIEKYSYTIKKCDLVTLFNQSWLNDEVINFYMILIGKRNEATEGYPSIHALTSFFYESLRKRGYDGVKRWTRKVNIFEKDIIIVPIHLQVHWCLLTIDLRKKEINYYDSMGSSNDACLMAFSNYLKEEHKTKLGKQLDLTDWKLTNVKNIPQQMNGSDCGVFACTYAEFSSRRAPFDFDQSKMPYFRRKMIYEIMTGQLL